jgi:hypothetical protein
MRVRRVEWDQAVVTTLPAVRAASLSEVGESYAEDMMVVRAVIMYASLISARLGVWSC